MANGCSCVKVRTSQTGSQGLLKLSEHSARVVSGRWPVGGDGRW